MLQIISALALLPAAATFVPDPDKAEPLTGPPPSIHAVKTVDADKGVVIVEKTTIDTVPVQEAFTVNIGGRVETRVRTVYKSVQKVTQHAYIIKDSRVQTAGGKDVPAAEALKRIKPGMPMLISGDGNPVSPGYLAIFQPETIVLIPAGQPAPPPPPLLPPPKKN
jgi:hypothetical protein